MSYHAIGSCTGLDDTFAFECSSDDLIQKLRDILAQDCKLDVIIYRSSSTEIDNKRYMVQFPELYAFASFYPKDLCNGLIIEAVKLFIEYVGREECYTMLGS